MKIAWDSELSPKDVNVFLKRFRDLYVLKDVTLSRYVKVTLVRAKARVALLKPLSIPRLELMACCIGSRLANSIVNALNLPNLRITFWSDSTTALWWIKEKRSWSVFVENRVKQIRQLTRGHLWKHVPGNLNIADLLSRGCSPQQMLISRWWEGPLWLRESPEYWPLGETPGDSEEVELERKKLKVVNIDLSRDAPPWHLYAISDYSKMIRVFSWILRFVNNCTLLNGKCKDSELSQSEIENSEKKLIRLVQSYYLPDAKSSNYIETYIDDEDALLLGVVGHEQSIAITELTFEALLMIYQKLNWSKIVEETRTPKILWKFIPPTAAWWGGWWERLVRTVKELLKRTLGRSVLKYDELYTVLCDCESIINCRPLTYVSENPEELIPLTPSMFLISNKNSNIEDIEELNSNSLNKRIKYRSKLLKDLRQRFTNEYLSQLIQKHNEKESRDPQIGEVVLVGDDNKKRLFWALAKIIELIPGRDGKIRTIHMYSERGKDELLGLRAQVYFECSQLGGVVGLSLAFCTQGCGFDPEPVAVVAETSSRGVVRYRYCRPDRGLPCHDVRRLYHEKDPLTTKDPSV
ncbi:integrase catalytic domain-containing protein [Trichonephila clavipes]|nr:integrase catalytic domain-containing protein [Trichonephila clavipes]